MASFQRRYVIQGLGGQPGWTTLRRERESAPAPADAAGGASRLRAANASTALICSRAISNCSTMSSMLAPASRFSNTADTGIRVLRKTHAPPSRPAGRRMGFSQHANARVRGVREPRSRREHRRHCRAVRYCARADQRGARVRGAEPRRAACGVCRCRGRCSFSSQRRPTRLAAKALNYIRC